jgi:hypothetical protein
VLTDDPEFVRSFEEQLRQPPSLLLQVGSTGGTPIAVALLFSVILLLAGFASAAVAFAGVTGLLWAMRRFSDGPSQEAARLGGMSGLHRPALIIAHHDDPSPERGRGHIIRWRRWGSDREARES